MNWTKKVIYFSIPFLVLLIALEIILRLFFPIIDPFVEKQRPYTRLTLFSDGTPMPGISGTTTFVTDELGFRTIEEIDYLRKPTNTIRIFLIGGSATEQLYIDDAKESGALLHEKLNDYLRSKNSIYQAEVINTGRSGLLSADHVRMAREIIKYNPDYVAFTMGINDLGAMLRTKGEAVANEHYYASKDRSRWQYWLTRPHVSRLFFHMRAVAKSIIKGEVMSPAGSHYAKKRTIRMDSPELELEASLREIPPYYSENIGLIRQLIEQQQLRGVFITQPTMWFANMPQELDKLLWMTPSDVRFKFDSGELDELMEKYNDVLRNIASDSDRIDLVDLSRLLPKDTSVFYDDVHFNDSGARRVADILAEYFIKEFSVQGI